MAEAAAQGSPKGGATKYRKGRSGRYVPIVEYNALRAEFVALKARWDAREASAGGGEITAAVMKQVMGQPRELDVGPTEALLRSWVDRDIKGFDARMRELAAEERGLAAQEEELAALRLEVAELRGKQAAAGGRSAADDLVDSILGVSDAG